MTNSRSPGQQGASHSTTWYNIQGASHSTTCRTAWCFTQYNVHQKLEALVTTHHLHTQKYVHDLILVIITTTTDSTTKNRNRVQHNNSNIDQTNTTTTDNKNQSRAVLRPTPPYYGGVGRSTARDTGTVRTGFTTPRTTVPVWFKVT